MSAPCPTSRFGAVLAALVRTQSLAAAGTALYRNQLVQPLPPIAHKPARRDSGKAQRHFAIPPVPFCPLLPRCVGD